MNTHHTTTTHPTITTAPHYPTVVRNLRRLLIVTALVLLAGGCSARGIPAEVRSGTTLAGDEPFVGHIDSPEVLLDESFDTDVHGWAGPLQQVRDGDYVWHVPSGRSVHTARDIEARGAAIDNVTVDVAFTADHAGMVGVSCARSGHHPGSGGYVLGLTGDGAVISRDMPLGQPDRILARNDDVHLTDQPTQLSAACRLAGDGYHLAVEINHRSVLEAVDAEPLGTGVPGLVVDVAGGGAPSATEARAVAVADHPAVVHFHAFEAWGSVPGIGA